MKYSIKRIMRYGKIKNPVTRYIRVVRNAPMKWDSGLCEMVYEPEYEKIPIEFDDKCIIEAYREKLKYYHNDLKDREVKLVQCPLDNKLRLHWLREEIEWLQKEIDKLCFEYYRMCGWFNAKGDELTPRIRAEDVKNRYTVMHLLSAYGIDVPRNKKILCISPDHNDHVPSMHVYDYSVYCFSCAEHYDTIGIVQLMEGVSFKEALKKLSK